MRLLLTRVVSLISISFSISSAWGQYTLRTAAGGGPNNIPAVGANSNSPEHLAYANGVLYVADAGEDRIFKVDQTGLVTVVAGSGWAVGLLGVPTGDGGPAINANVAKPSAVAVDAAGNVYFVDSFGLRRVDTSGVISTLPNAACLNFGGNDFEFPMPIALDPSGQFLYCVTSYGYPAGTSVVSQVNLSTFAVTPFAGGGSSSADNVPPTSEELDIVNGLAVSSTGDVYIAGASNNHVAWKVSAGSITHIAGGGVLPPNNNLATSANLGSMQDIALDSANDVFLSDGIHIYRIDASTQMITLYAGAPPINCPNPPYINDGGPALDACFEDAAGIIVDTSTNDLYFSDSGTAAAVSYTGSDHLVRRISATSPNIVQTVLGNVFPNGLGQGGFEFLSGDRYAATDARLGPTTQGMAIDPSGNVFIGDFYNYTVRRVDAVTGVITSILPNPGVYSNFTPYFMAAGPDGTIYVNTTYPDTGNPTTIWSIRDGTMTAVTSFTGSLNGAVCTYIPDGVPANSGCIGYPQGISVDGAGNLYVADQKFCTIRQISPNGTLGTVTGIAGTCATGGDGGPAAAATVGDPTLLASDSAGNIWFADCGSSFCGPASEAFALRRITADRSLIATIWLPQPNTVQLLSLGVDNQGNALAQIYSPSAWAGICGASGYCIVRISTSGSLTLIAGAGPTGIPSPDGVSALGATLGCVDLAPTFLGGLAVNTTGQIFFAESCSGMNFAGSYGGVTWGTNNTIRRLDPTFQLLPQSQISATASGLAYSRVTKTYNGTVTIKNISNVMFAGPFQIVLSNLTSGVQLGDSTGQYNGSPYITVSGTASLAPDQSATVSVQFTDPSNSAINFTPLIYSGSF